MSELKAYNVICIDDISADYNVDALGAPAFEAYACDEADKAIAELKDKIQMHDFFWEGCGFNKLGFKNAIAVRDYCDKLKAENERLNNLLNVWNTYKILGNTFNELKATKHALWLMTAEWAEAMGLASCNIAAKFMSRENFEVSDDYRNKTIKKYRHRQVVFCKYANYCRKKAAEAK